MPHLPYDELPPLADYDYAKHLVARGFKELDPMMRKGKKRRHMFWGMMAIFRESQCFWLIMLNTLITYHLPLHLGHDYINLCIWLMLFVRFLKCCPRPTGQLQT
jgi:hypothetical protein